MGYVHKYCLHPDELKAYIQTLPYKTHKRATAHG